MRKIITLSNGYYFSLLDLKRYGKRLVKPQRQLSRKQYPKKRGGKTAFSNNYRKQQKKISKLWLKIANARYGYLHKVSTAVAKNHGLVAVEDLKIKI